MPAPALSLIVPTRGRDAPLSRFLDSIASTASDLSRIEIVLVVDADALPTLGATDPRLRLSWVVGPSGRSMGALNADGYAASHGTFVLLLNDDVVVRTPRWDDRVLAAARHFLDGVVLVHVNDTLMRQNLCTFPLVSRSLCELMGGICPREYLRYCIDDHVEDVFNLLAFLGERRTIYLPEVVFEHTNAVQMAPGVREYHSEPGTLALDGPRFLALFDERKRFVLDLLDLIAPDGSRPIREAALAAVRDPVALRVPTRQIVWSAKPPPTRLNVMATRFWRCWRERGVRGLLRAATRRIRR